MTEETDWKAREGQRDELRSHAQRLDPNLTAYCNLCGKKFEGAHLDLVEQMTKHRGEDHGNSDKDNHQLSQGA